MRMVFEFDIGQEVGRCSSKNNESLGSAASIA